MTENTTAFRKYRLRPRVLVDVSSADTSTTVLGQKIPFPLCVAPAGIQAMAHPEGELATSRACASRGINMGVSSFSNYSIEDVRVAGLAVGPLQHAMQLYSMQDRSMQLRIIRRAEKAGCAAIFLTADSPVLGVRHNEMRNDFRTPEGLSFPMLERTSEAIRAQTHDGGFASFNSSSHSWAKEIPWLRSVTQMPIWIKGILTAEDVELAIEYGCDGVIVSNHGGRQLDQTPATVDALPECVKAARGKIDVHMDGGIRNGADIFKALALGAKCVWIGRPVIYGLAVGDNMNYHHDLRKHEPLGEHSLTEMDSTTERPESQRQSTYSVQNSRGACNCVDARALPTSPLRPSAPFPKMGSTQDYNVSPDD